jgi:hypothetical protein
MRRLIAVESCNAYRRRTKAQRETWANGIEGADLRFFVGGGEVQAGDEVVLPVDDGYAGLPSKTQAICGWALANGYDELFKTDDDVYVRPERLLAAGMGNHDYVGRVRGPSGIFPAPYCSGFAYWLSARAMKIITETPGNGDQAEDRWVGNTLRQHEIWPNPDYRYVVMSSQRNAVSFREGPRQGNNVIAACEFEPAAMHQVHQAFLTEPSRIVRRQVSGPLSKVAVLVKTFLRDGLLCKCLAGIERTLPEVKIIVVDDGYESGHKITLYSHLRELGHVCLWLPFDSGFGAKANAAIPFFADHQYVLIASDDFNFDDQGIRAGIEKMVAVLDGDPSIHIVSGRVDGRPYESLLEVDGDFVRETAGHRETREVNGVTYRVCDLTVNFSLIRSSCFGDDKLHWDGKEVKIGGGEHGAFYLDAKRLGFGVAVIEDVSIRQLPWDFSLIHPSYPQMRNRALHAGRSCLKARGINRWQLQNGRLEHC